MDSRILCLTLTLTLTLMLSYSIVYALVVPSQDNEQTFQREPVGFSLQSGIFPISDYGFSSTTETDYNFTILNLKGNFSNYTIHVGVQTAFSYYDGPPSFAFFCNVQNQQSVIMPSGRSVNSGPLTQDVSCNYHADDFIIFNYTLLFQSPAAPSYPMTLFFNYAFLSVDSKYFSNISLVSVKNTYTTPRESYIFF